MEESFVKFGVVGTGCIGMEHLRNLALLPNAYVCAVADNHAPSLKNAEEELKKSGKEFKLYEDFVHLLQDEEVDVVVIATPNNHHINVLREAVKYKKHLMIEKPLCTTIEDCREVLKLYENYPKMVWVGMEYRYIPSVSRCIQELEKGTVGRIRMVTIREHRFPFLLKVNNWNRFTENTGGTLVEKCCHFFDLFLKMIPSRPVRVYATGGQDVNHLNEVYDGKTSDILDNAYVLIDFEDRTRACLDLCMFAEASKYQEEITVVGETGKIEAFAPAHGHKSDDPNFINLRIGRRSGFVTSERPPDVEKMVPLEEHHIGVDESLLQAGCHEGATYFEFVEMMKVIQKERAKKEKKEEEVEVEVGLREGVCAVALGIAAHMSIREGRSVNIDEILPLKTFEKK